MYLAFCLGFLSLLYAIKLPILCSGCEEQTKFSRSFFRCIGDTGPGSYACNYQKKLDSALNDVGGFVSRETKELREQLRKSFDVLGDAPAEIKQAALNLFRKIINMHTNIISNFKNIVSRIQKEVAELLKSIKKSFLTSIENVYKYIIYPTVNKIITYIVNPVKEIIEEIQRFKDKLTDAVESGLGKVTGAIMTVPNLIFGAIDNIVKTIPTAIQAILDAIRFLINNAIKGLVTTVNTIVVDPIQAGISTVTDGVNTATKPVFDAYGKLRNTTLKTPKIPIPIPGVPDIPSQKITSLNFLPKLPDMKIPNHGIKDINIGDVIGPINISALDKLKSFSTKDVASTAVNAVFDVAKKGYNEVITLMNTMIESIKGLYDTIFIELKNAILYLIKMRDDIIIEIIKTGKNVINLIKVEFVRIFTPVVKFFVDTSKEIIKYIKEFGSVVMKLFNSIIRKVAGFMSEIAKVVAKFIEYIGKNAKYGIVYVLGHTANKTIGQIPPFTGLSTTNQIGILVVLLLTIIFPAQLFLADRVVSTGVKGIRKIGNGLNRGFGTTGITLSI